MASSGQFGHGGARSGAGRPRLTLAQLVKARRFDAHNPRHRRALLDDEFPAGLAPELERTALAYRREGGGAAASWIAQRFAAGVTDPDAEERRERHSARLRAQDRRARGLQERLAREQQREGARALWRSR